MQEMVLRRNSSPVLCFPYLHILPPLFRTQTHRKMPNKEHSQKNTDKVRSGVLCVNKGRQERWLGFRVSSLTNTVGCKVETQLSLFCLFLIPIINKISHKQIISYAIFLHTLFQVIKRNRNNKGFRIKPACYYCFFPLSTLFSSFLLFYTT